MEDNSAQDDEILAIHSIYEEDETFIFDNDTKIGKFFVKISADDSKSFCLKFDNEGTEVKVEHLPPILIEFEFMSDYPSTNPPKFTLNCRWLSYQNISKLCVKLDDLWVENENESILFTWISFLTDEIFEYLDLDVNNIIITNASNNTENNFDVRAIKPPCSILLFRNYDKDQIDLKFQNSYFTCQVCFTDKIGKDCMKFHKCDHVFCNECMKGYFESQITSGEYNNLNCPYSNCETQALQTQVLNLVGVEMFNKYDGLLLKDSLNNMQDIVYCPRAKCQSPVIPEQTLAQCNAPGCNYVFCALCRQGYHGIEPCKISNNELKQLCEEYKSGNSELRQELSKRYGEKRIKTALEEFSSMELIANTSKQCPKCRTWMQKLEGCNKMTCSKCLCYFCWLCLTHLSKNDPYSHFNKMNSECFEKLFEGTWVNNENE